MFKFSQHQLEDLPRAAMRDGLILAWCPGAGKTIAAFVWPMLKKSKQCLIVATADLHPQIIDEGMKFFGTTVTQIKSQRHYHQLVKEGKLSANPTSQPPLEKSSPEFFITDYGWLGYNGADERAYKKKEATATIIRRRSKTLENIIGHTPTSSDIDLFSEGIGSIRNGIRCVHTPSLSSLIQSHFDTVVCDEAVRLKSNSTHMAHGVFNLDCIYRLAMTGTPIKNNLGDIFHLACWVTGNHTEPTALWPYGNTTKARQEFIADHLISRENLSRYNESLRTGKPRRSRTKTNQICNVQRLWKVLAPIMIRRRKDQLGGKLVKKTLIPIRVPSGTEQQKCYQHHLKNPPLVIPKNRSRTAKITALKESKGAQLQCLRQISLTPTSPKLTDKNNPHNAQRSTNPFTPKLAATLKLIADLTSQGEQVVVFSTFCDFSTILQQKLAQASLPSIILDGRLTPTERGHLAKEFKQGKHAVMIAGIDSMSEGHSLECASNLIMPSLSWAYDTNSQAVERVHRLTSLKNVSIYYIITNNTLDERMETVYLEKSNSQDLALDGCLTIKDERPPNLAELMEDAIGDFDPNSETLAESTAESQWNSTILPRMTLAAKQWPNRFSLVA